MQQKMIKQRKMKMGTKEIKNTKNYQKNWKKKKTKCEETR